MDADRHQHDPMGGVYAGRQITEVVVFFWREIHFPCHSSEGWVRTDRETINRMRLKGRTHTSERRSHRVGRDAITVSHGVYCRWLCDPSVRTMDADRHQHDTVDGVMLEWITKVDVNFRC